MTVRVRLFAAVREAAGTPELSVPAASLPDLLAGLRERFGQPFTDRLDRCTVLVDGSATRQDADVPVADGAEVVLLPPVSGGARRADDGRSAQPADEVERSGGPRALRASLIRFLFAVLLAVVGFGALVAGPLPLTVVVLAVAVAVLVDLSQLLAGAVARPVLPAALLPGLVLPAMVAGDVAADPAAGWDRVPGVFAVTFLLGFALVLVFGRRAGVVAGLSATMTAALLVGLGASGVILLRGLPDGVLWLLALAVLVVAADAAGPLARRIRAVRARRGDRAGPDLAPADLASTDRASTDRAPADLGPADLAPADRRIPSPAAALLPAVVAVTIVALVLGWVLGPPLEPLVLVALACIALVAAFGAGYLERTLVAEATAARDAPAPIGSGVLLGVADAMLLAAPAGYLLARAVAL